MSKTCLHISFAVILTLFVVNLKISKGATMMFESYRTVYVIKCVIPVNLIFTATDKPRGVLVNDEFKELCRTMPLDLQKRRKRSLLQSDLPKIWGALPVFEKNIDLQVVCCNLSQSWKRYVGHHNWLCPRPIYRLVRDFLIGDIKKSLD